MASNDNLTMVAQNKIDELIGNQATANMPIGTMHRSNNTGYSTSSGDNYTYQINSPDYVIGGGYVDPQNSWGDVGNATTIGSTDWSQQLARLAEDPAKRKEDQMLKQMPMDMTIERMKRCAGCTYANAVHCMHRFKNGKTDSPCPCNQRDMLVYGHCPKFISMEQVEIELAAEGIDDGKE